MHRLDLPHHDGSPLHVGEPHPRCSRSSRRAYASPQPPGWTPCTSGSSSTASPPSLSPPEAERRDDPAADGTAWWRMDLAVANPVTSYRFLLTGPGG